MAINLEQLQAKWRELDVHPAAFDITQPNFADLAVRELLPTLGEVLGPLGYRQVDAADLPDLQRWSPFDQRKLYGVKTVEELPGWLLDALKKQKSLGFKKVIDDWVCPAWDRYHRPLIPENDQLYFLRGEKGNERYSAIALRHNSRMITPYWKVMWTLQVDTMVGIDPDITAEMASSLVPSQDVRSQYGVGRARLIHRERFNDGERYAPIYVDKNLIYSQHLIVKRNGEYPFKDESKTALFDEIGQTLRNSISYDEQYRLGLLDVYKHAIGLGLPIERVFASKQA